MTSGMYEIPKFLRNRGERNLAVFFARFQQSFRFGLLVKCWSLVGRVLVYKK